MGKKKPPTITVGRIHATPRKPPTKTCPHWWYQVYRYEDGRQVSMSGQHLRADGDTVHRHLCALVAAEQDKPSAGAGKPNVAVELTVGEGVRLWLGSCKARSQGKGRPKMSPVTYQNYLRTWRNQIKPHPIAHLTANGLTIGDQQDWIDSMVGSPRSIKSWYTVLRIALSYGVRVGRIKRIPPRAALPSVEQYVYCHETPTPEEGWAVVQSLDGWASIVGEILYRTGARIGEIAPLRIRDWNQRTGQIRLAGKTGVRWFPVSEQLGRCLRMWIGDRASGRLLPVTDQTVSADFSYRHLRAACADLDLPRFTAHSFRRMVATRLIGSGIDPKTYESLMGHSWAMGMGIYAQVNNQAAASAAAMLNPPDRSDGDGEFTETADNIIPFADRTG
ncbi:MAG: tyrosine-type recombinase/integrase [Myxococcota bacterium]